MSETFDIEPEFKASVASLLVHIRQRLLIRGIPFQPSQLDYRVVKYVVELFRKNNKTDYSLIKFIDESLDEVTEARGIGLLGSLARKKLGVVTVKKRYRKSISFDVELSNKLQDNMKQLKKKYGFK